MKTANQTFLEAFNKAFANSDTEFLLGNVTDDIRWMVVGEPIVEGKEAFSAALKRMEMEEPMKLTIHNIITHGKSAAVNGVMETTDGKAYAFCDIYKFSGFKNAKIKEMTSYALEVDKQIA
ncbi:MAG: nuclear transport factor 2 family protein [Balneolaceae bacterium]